jgi:hypothetical protein
MPALGAVIHVSKQPCSKEYLDGRDEPGHDGRATRMRRDESAEARTDVPETAAAQGFAGLTSHPDLISFGCRISADRFTHP